jgi:hypothetical protein
MIGTVADGKHGSRSGVSSSAESLHDLALGRALFPGIVARAGCGLIVTTPARRCGGFLPFVAKFSRGSRASASPKIVELPPVDVHRVHGTCL